MKLFLEIKFMPFIAIWRFGYLLFYQVFYLYHLTLSSVKISYLWNCLNGVIKFIYLHYGHNVLPRCITNAIHSYVCKTAVFNWLLTCWIALKLSKMYITLRFIFWILFNRRRPNSQWSNTICCLSHTVNTMPADVLWTWRSQVTSQHDIDQIRRNIPSLVSEELTYPLQWHHISIMASQITCNSIVCSTAC